MRYARFFIPTVAATATLVAALWFGTGTAAASYCGPPPVCRFNTHPVCHPEPHSAPRWICVPDTKSYRLIETTMTKAPPLIENPMTRPPGPPKPMPVSRIR